MLASLWCLVLGGVLTTLGIVNTTALVWDKWDAVGILGFLTLVVGIVQIAIDKGWIND